MGTKTSPAKHDCYARALPDEEMFVLLARDPLAPFLVSIWAAARIGATTTAAEVLEQLLEVSRIAYLDAPEPAAAVEAAECSTRMLVWRDANEGRWREPQPSSASGSGGTVQLLDVDAEGWGSIAVDGQAESRWIYTGVRAACVGADPKDPGKAIVVMDGGAAPPADHEAPDGVVFRISTAGLRAMAAELVAAADQVDAARVIDIRKVI